MNLLLAFAPFIVFVVVERLAGIPAGLAAAAWAAAFGVLVLADVVMAFAPALPRAGSVLATAMALAAAAWFTGWYPEHRRPLKQT